MLLTSFFTLVWASRTSVRISSAVPHRPARRCPCAAAPRLTTTRSACEPPRQPAHPANLPTPAARPICSEELSIPDSTITDVPQVRRADSRDTRARACLPRTPGHPLNHPCGVLSETSGSPRARSMHCASRRRCFAATAYVLVGEGAGRSLPPCPTSVRLCTDRARQLDRVGQSGGNVIIRGGFDVHPREIEELLMEHLTVSLVAVIGVPTSLTTEAELVARASRHQGWARRWTRHVVPGRGWRRLRPARSRTGHIFFVMVIATRRVQSYASAAPIEAHISARRARHRRLAALRTGRAKRLPIDLARADQPQPPRRGRPTAQAGRQTLLGLSIQSVPIPDSVITVHRRWLVLIDRKSLEILLVGTRYCAVAVGPGCRRYATKSDGERVSPMYEK